MLTIKKLETAQKVLEHIKKLDAQIIQLEKLAELAARGETTTQLSMIIRDFRPKKENYEDSYQPVEKSVFQQLRSYNIHRAIIIDDPFTEKKDPALASLVVDITDTVMLQVMAVILEDRKEERQNCINKLTKMGFQL